MAVVDIEKKLRTKRRHHAVKPQLLDIRRLDQRSNAAKEFNQLIAKITADLGHDLSGIETELVHTFAAACITIRRISAEIALGQQVDAAGLSAIGGLALKIAAKLGLKQRRVADGAAPDPLQYARDHAAGGAA